MRHYAKFRSLGKKQTNINLFRLIDDIKLVACLLINNYSITRLREENSQAKGFFRTLNQLYKEGGRRQLYRGISIQVRFAF